MNQHVIHKQRRGLIWHAPLDNQLVTNRLFFVVSGFLRPFLGSPFSHKLFWLPNICLPSFRYHSKTVSWKNALVRICLGNPFPSNRVHHAHKSGITLDKNLGQILCVWDRYVSSQFQEGRLDEVNSPIWSFESRGRNLEIL